MYYDRRLFPPLLDVLAPNGAMGWLVPLLRSPWGDAYFADLHFRGDRQGHGFFELYFGRTGPLRVRSFADDRYALEADPFYTAVDRGLFDVRVDARELAEFAPRIRKYLDAAGAIASQSLVDGEGRLQGMLGRTHGLLASRLRHAILLDREVVLGHHGMGEKRTRDGAVRAALGGGDEVTAHNKLDGVALLEDLRTGLIEVKPRGGDLTKGSLQLVAYRRRFEDLAKQWNGWASVGLAAILQQKAHLGLLPSLQLVPRDVIVPVLASADDRTGWADTWRAEIASVRAAHPDALADLVLWRLNDRGEILEAVPAWGNPRHTPWYRERRQVQTDWKRTTDTLPAEAKVPGKTMVENERDGTREEKGPYPVCLPLDHASRNLLEPIRAEAIARFRAAGVAWHHWTEGPDGAIWPSSHLLSSQVQCVNVLLSLEREPERLLAWAKAIVPDAIELVPVQGKELVSFEWTGPDGADFLRERSGRRVGRKYQTSPDAVLLIRCLGGITALLVEWKDTEYYPSPKPLTTWRRRTYAPLVAEEGGPLLPVVRLEAYFWEPHYQLMRLHLLASQFLRRLPGVTAAIVVHVIPTGNTYLRELVPAALQGLGRTVADVWPRIVRPSCGVTYRLVDSDPLLEATSPLAERYAQGLGDVGSGRREGSGTKHARR